MLATVATKAPLVCPEATATLPGTVILALLLESVSADPPEGAALDSVTVQFDVPGAFTVAGEQLKLEGCAVTVKATVVDWLIPFREAVTVTFCAVVTVAAVAENVAFA
jgi:hypothetical protein